jgi:pantoate--beta-alanine ligase
VEVIAHPIVREGDGLAMSSRNTYLSEEERLSSLSLSRSLSAARGMVAGGERRVDLLVSKVRDLIESEPHTRVQYVQVIDAETLQDLSQVTPRAIMALAVFVGKARLIDNMRLWPD